MSILKIPGYFYFGTETKQGALCFYKSDTLLAKCQQGFNYVVEGSALNNIDNPRAFVNNYLGEDALSPDKEHLTITFINDESRPTWVGELLTKTQMSPTTEYRPANNSTNIAKFVTLNSFEITSNEISAGSIFSSDYYYTLGGIYRDRIRFIDQGTQLVEQIYMCVWPDNLFVGGIINPDLPDQVYMIDVQIVFNLDYSLKRISINGSSYGYFGHVFKEMFRGFNLNGSSAEDEDTENPYGNNPDKDPGGDGERPGETIEPTGVPDLPDISAASLGLISIYTPTIAQIQALSGYLWSGAFDPDSFKKLFSDPMECMIGLGIVPAVPTSAGTKNVRFGNVDSGISMSYVNTQWVSVNCGSVKIEKDIASFLDYDPYTKLSLYLPFIGFRDISCDDVMGGSIQVVYNMDILTGSCSAFVKHSTRGVLYNYNGNCIANIPINAANYSAAIQNAVTTVASGVGVLAGMATGAAPVTAMTAVSMFNSAANTALSSKPTIQRTGNLGGVAGLLSVKKPYLIIQRPNKSVPDYVQNYVGLTCNKTLSLGSCHGFTMIDQCHIEGISATPGEITEIETLLKQGVIL